MDTVLKSFEKIYIILKNVKYILYFLIMISILIGISARIIFYKEEEYYDNNETPYFIWNFSSLGKSLYSGMVITLIGGGIHESIMHSYGVSWLKCLYWVFVFVVFKLIINNFLIGSLYL